MKFLAQSLLLFLPLEGGGRHTKAKRRWTGGGDVMDNDIHRHGARFAALALACSPLKGEQGGCA
jgi:hypothetical protein